MTNHLKPYHGHCRQRSGQCSGTYHRSIQALQLVLELVVGGHILAQFILGLCFAPLFGAYFCFSTGKQPPDIAMMAGPDKATKQ